MPADALSCFRCGLDDLLAMPFRHRTLVFLNEMEVAPLGLLRISVVAARLFQNLLALGQREPLSARGVRREKAALSSGCKSHPATAPAGSNRSSHGGNEMAEAFG